MSKRFDHRRASGPTRRAVIGGGAAAGVALATGLLPSRGAAQAVEQREITVGVGPDWGTGGHAVIAVLKGYFAEEGIQKVNLKTFPAGLVQLEAMAAGSIDFANPAQTPVFTLRAAGIPIVVLSSLAAYHDSVGIATRKEAKVVNPTDLYGKKIGLLKGSGSELMLTAFIREYKLDASKIQVVSLAPPEQLASLASGAIDGICVWQPWVHQASQKTAVDVVHTGATSHFATNKGQRVLIDYTRGVAVTTERYARANPNTVDALLRAYAKSQAYATNPANFDELVKIFSAHFNQQVADNQVIIKGYYSSLALDKAYADDMEAIQDFLMSTGRLKQKLSLAEVTYGGPLKRVNPAWVSIPVREKL